MKPYNVEIFTQDFEMVGNTNVNEITYKEDYLSSDGNTVTVLALSGIRKQDYIRISRGGEEYAGIVTEMVRVAIPDLNIRKGPGKSYPKTGKFTGVGVFNIVEEKDGWGLLKAYAEKRDGWISLAFTTRM